MMLRGLWHLTWLEIKIFVREPLGLFGTIGVPVLMFVVLARGLAPYQASRKIPSVLSADLPIFAALFIAASTVLSLVTIIAIYREGGILKRLRATPLRPHTILTAHVLVKLISTAATLVLMFLAGRRYFAVDAGVPVVSFTVALLFSTVTLASLGFVIASLAPTARFAQPIGSLIIYPMLGLSGLFVPLDRLPPTAEAVARVLPFTYAVSLLRGIWHGDGWLAHTSDVAGLVIILVLSLAISARWFRWQ